MLLSWIPGVVMILTTRNSQRSGDRLADTVVVRTLSQIDGNEVSTKSVQTM